MMTKKEYLATLAKELQSLPYDEQKEALEYYQNYFNDARVENEQTVMSELGSVEALGAHIRSNFSCIPEKLPNKKKKHSEGNMNKKAKKPSVQDTTIGKWLIIILIIVTFPLWIGPVLGILGTILGLIFTIISIAFAGIIVAISVGCAGIIAAIALFFSGIVALIAGFAFVTTPFSDLLGLGLCLFLLGGALLMGIFGVWLCAKVVPLIIRGIVALFRLPFKNLRKRGN